MLVEFSDVFMIRAFSLYPGSVACSPVDVPMVFVEDLLSAWALIRRNGLKIGHLRVPGLMSH